MKIIHICNNYVSSKVHRELIKNIAINKICKQEVFIPIRKKSLLEVNYLNHEDVNLKYCNYYFNFLKYFPLLKVFLIFILFSLKVKVEKNDYIIAHNFWSDGFLAFMANIFKKNKYVLVVRSTDMNLFIPRLKFYHFIMNMMIKRSEGLIFINKCYEKDFLIKYPNLYKSAKTIHVIFNGVDSFWLRNSTFNKIKKNKDQLIYVGNFNNNKNIRGIVEATRIVYKHNPKVELLLVGGDEDDFRNIFSDEKNIPSYIKILGKITCKKTLLDLYRESKVFIMPSFFETFGLVYIEALLQGCSIIHSKDQGIDGIFDEDCIVAVNPHSYEDIAYHIEQLLNQYDRKLIKADFQEKLLENFDWKFISSKYLRVFEK